MAGYSGVDFIDFDSQLNDEEKLVRQTARQFVENEIIPIIEKHSREGTFPKHLVPQLGELDYLLNSADDRAGALGFGLGQEPPAPRRKFNKTIELAKLQQIAEALMREEDVKTEEAVQVQDLMLIGTSMGGARPKVVVEDKDGLWVAKFNRPDDRWNNTRVEHAMLELAKACGISVAASRRESSFISRSR